MYGIVTGIVPESFYCLGSIHKHFEPLFNKKNKEKEYYKKFKKFRRKSIRNKK